MNDQPPPPLPPSRGGTILPVVLTILGVLVAAVVGIGVLVTFQMRSAVNRAVLAAQKANTQAVLRQLRQALAAYQMDTGALPPDGCPHLMEALDGRDGGRKYADFGQMSLVGGVVADPWGHPIIYRRGTAPGERWILRSVGPDGRDDNGAGDDITDRPGF